MPGAEIIRRYGFDPEAQARARARRIELTLWELGHRAALIVTGFALAPVAKPILDTFTRAIPLRWLAVLLYTYVILVLTRWSLPFLLVHLSRMDVRDGLLEAARRPFLRALTRSLVVLLAATPIFAFVYGLSFSPWQKANWNPVFYAVFVSFVELFLAVFYRGRLRPADEALTQRAKELGKRIKVKSPRLRYLEVPEQAPGGAAYLVIWLWDAIVLTRNLRNQLTMEELDVVLAHELAHRKEGWTLALVFGLRVFPLVVFVGFLLPHLCDLYGIHRFGVEALPLFIALCETALLLASPLERALMRWAERRADRLALKATGNPAAFASTMIKLYDGNLIDAAPGRLWQLLFGSHPTGLERVKLARCWKPG